MAHCLTANEITEVTGILNGTTNFILTKMIDDNMSFESALKLAQELGYAEKDPTADIEGFNLLRINMLTKCQSGKYTYFSASVKSFNICSWVFLCISKLLRKLKCRFE